MMWLAPLIVFAVIVTALYVWSFCRASARADEIARTIHAADASAESYNGMQGGDGAHRLV